MQSFKEKRLAEFDKFNKQWETEGYLSMDELKDFITESIDQAVEKERDRIREIIMEMKKVGNSIHGNCCTCQDGCKQLHDECTCEYNSGLADILSFLNNQSNK